jgi:hypothetical protein
VSSLTPVLRHPFSHVTHTARRSEKSLEAQSRLTHVPPMSCSPDDITFILFSTAAQRVCRGPLRHIDDIEVSHILVAAGCAVRLLPSRKRCPKRGFSGHTKFNMRIRPICM